MTVVKLATNAIFSNSTELTRLDAWRNTLLSGLAAVAIPELVVLRITRFVPFAELGSLVPISLLPFGHFAVANREMHVYADYTVERVRLHLNYVVRGITRRR